MAAASRLKRRNCSSLTKIALTNRQRDAIAALRLSDSERAGEFSPLWRLFSELEYKIDNLALSTPPFREKALGGKEYIVENLYARYIPLRLLSSIQSELSITPAQASRFLLDWAIKVANLPLNGTKIAILASYPHAIAAMREEFGYGQLITFASLGHWLGICPDLLHPGKFFPFTTLLKKFISTLVANGDARIQNLKNTGIDSLLGQSKFAFWLMPPPPASPDRCTDFTCREFLGLLLPTRPNSQGKSYFHVDFLKRAEAICTSTQNGHIYRLWQKNRLEFIAADPGSLSDCMDNSNPAATINLFDLRLGDTCTNDSGCIQMANNFIGEMVFNQGYNAVDIVASPSMKPIRLAHINTIFYRDFKHSCYYNQKLIPNPNKLVKSILDL